MNLLPYQKWDATGNDFVVIHEANSPFSADLFPSDLVVRLCDRAQGVGADGVVILRAPVVSSGPDEMVIWNSDGSRGDMCGNALRCVAMVLSRGSSDLPRQVKVGQRLVHTRVDSLESSTVLMGPVAAVGDEPALANLPELDQIMGGRGYLLSFGNPHYVVPAEAIPDDWVARGAEAQAVAHQRLGTGGINCGFLGTTPDGEGVFPLCVFERGVGVTQSCGSGACAASAVLERRLDIAPPHRLRLPGGVLRIGRGEAGFELTGPARLDFEGEWEL